MTKIRFNIIYECKLKRKFEKFLKIYSRQTGFNFLEMKLEKYWKEQKQFQATFFTETESMNKEIVVYEVLCLANKLYSTGYGRWTIYGPHENESLKFECILNNYCDDQPLKWAHIEIDN